MAYTKLDGGITDSTIWQAPDTTRIVWITMLAMADQNGYVGASVPGLAGRARVSMEACIAALESFLGPDKWSRTRDHDGRRIVEAEGGWVLLSHAKYRAAQNADDRRERSRIAMANLRQQRKQALTVSKVNNELTELIQAEAAPATTPKEEEREMQPTSLKAHKPEEVQAGFKTFWEIWPKNHRKGGLKKCLEVWEAKHLESNAQEILAHVKAMSSTSDWTEGERKYVPAPVVYLRSEAWSGAEIQAVNGFEGSI